MHNGVSLGRLIGKEGGRKQLEAWRSLNAAGYPAHMQRIMRIVSCSMSAVYDPEARHVLHMIYCEGKTIEETAGLMGLKKETVRRLKAAGIKDFEMRFAILARVKGLIIPREIAEDCQFLAQEAAEDE